MTRSAKEQSQSPPLTDSPWFWVVVFSLCGMGALVAIGNKYGRRQAGIERRYQARQRLQENDRTARAASADASPAASDTDQPRPFSEAGDTLIPLWPIGVLLGGLALLAAVMLFRQQLSQARQQSS